MFPLFSAFLSGSVPTAVSGHLDENLLEVSASRPAHYLSTGAIMSLLAFLYGEFLTS